MDDTDILTQRMYGWVTGLLMGLVVGYGCAVLATIAVNAG